MLQHAKRANSSWLGKSKKRATSTSTSGEIATGASLTSASPGKVVSANGSSVSMYPGDAPSRRVIRICSK